MSDGSPNSMSPIGDLLATALRRAFSGGRRGVTRAAEYGRGRMEIRQLQRDRDALWIRLGKTAYHLVGDGEIEDHPALRKAIDRIEGLEQQIESLRNADRN